MRIHLYLLLGLCMAFDQTSDVYIDFHQDAKNMLSCALKSSRESVSVIITLTIFLNAEYLTRPSIFATSYMFHFTKAL